MSTGKKGEGRSPVQSRSLSLSLSRLRGVQRRFEAWRRERKGRARIPEPLWRAAVKMAEIYGVNRAATALRLDYYTLKKRLEAKANAGRDGSSGAEGGIPFLEMTPLGSIGTGECTVELEDFKGATMRIQLRGYAAPDLAALTRSFWSSDP
jgi:hypothetical protein